MPKTCPRCRHDAADDDAFCPRCGAALDLPSPPSSAPPPYSPSRAPTPSGPSVRPYRFDAARWSLADRISGVATIVLFISLFLSWFGVTVVGITVTASGVSAHGWLYIVMIVCIFEVAYLGLRAGWGELPVATQFPHLAVMMVATIVDFVLVLIAFIDKPGGSGVGWEIGAFLALVSAAVAAAPYTIPRSCAPRRWAEPRYGDETEPGDAEGRAT